MGKIAPILVVLLMATACVHPQTTNEFESNDEPEAVPQSTIVRDVVVGEDEPAPGTAPAPASASAAPTDGPPPSNGADPATEAEKAAGPGPGVEIESPHHESPRRELREPQLFRLGAGLGALGHIDLGPCRDQGLQSGYVHVHLTFRHSGRVVRAAVEAPTAPPPEALACIGEQVEAAMVPLFDGGDVRLSRNFYVN